MNEPSIVHSTFVIERRLPAPAPRVFAALSDPVQVRRWYAEGDGRSAEVFEMDFTVYGRQHMGSRMGDQTPFPGALLESDAVFLDITPDRRLVMAQTMTLGGRRISASLISYEILEMDGGSELVFTHQGAFFEGSGGPEMREEGWRHLLEGLARALAG
jgi:uncharacterized protein YndB with AHSA1/START domain